MLEIDHIGYAVKRMEKALDEFKALGFEFEDIIEDLDRNLYICFGGNGTYRIELVSPISKEKSSPADAYLSKVGPTAYHICYRSQNLEEGVRSLEGKGFRVLVEPQRAVAFSCCGEKKVVFLRGRNSGLVEIVEA